VGFLEEEGDDGAGVEEEVHAGVRLPIPLAAGFLDGVQVCAAVSGDRGSGQVAGGGEWCGRGGRGDENEADGLKSGFELAGFEVESGVHGVLLGSGQIGDRGFADADFDVLSGLLNEAEVVGQMGLQFGGLDLHVTKLVDRVGHVKWKGSGGRR
jgi:hypothetical protein